MNGLTEEKLRSVNPHRTYIMKMGLLTKAYLDPKMVLTLTNLLVCIVWTRTKSSRNSEGQKSFRSTQNSSNRDQNLKEISEMLFKTCGWEA